MPEKQRGFSLIEVLVAVLVLGVGLLGAAALQLLSLQNISNAELRTQATLFAQELTELARTTSTPTDFVQSGGSTASCASLSGQFQTWCDAMSQTLPDATFESSWDGAVSEFTVQVLWPERIMFLDATSTTSAGEGVSDYTLVTRFQ
nr:type IV pilus modification protein PilV [Marinobacter daepoensis]